MLTTKDGFQAVKLQRPVEGYRVQSLRGAGRDHQRALSVESAPHQLNPWIAVTKL